MKNSMNKSQENTVIKDESCSEKKCATCFQNNGCMFEQYLGASIHNIDELRRENNTDLNPVISKRA